MSLTARLITTGTVLTLAYCSQLAIIRHVRSAGEPAAGELQLALDNLPMQIGSWRGQTRPITNPEATYGDAHLQREYRSPDRSQRVVVWIAYSKQGKDRAHHPEICMAVAGQPEDPSARQQIRLTGTGAPAQQYRFGRTGSSQWIYYWYYTLVAEQPKATSWLQRLYQAGRYRAASVTIEVFAPEADPKDEQGAQEFVKLLDKAVGPLVGPTAIRGSQRLAVVRIDTQT